MGKYKYQEEWQKKRGYQSVSIKLHKPLYIEFGKTCDRLETTRAKEITKFMRDFIDKHKEEKE